VNVPALRFPEFEGEWEAGRLGDVSRFSKGKGISKSDIVEGGKLPCVRYGELYTTYGRIIENIVSFTNVDKADLRMSEGGEILVPASGETSYDIATATVLPFGGVAIGGDLNVIETNENRFFIASYLSGVGKKHLARMAQGNSVVHLYKDQIASSKIKLPTIAEQKKIAAFLGAVDYKLAALTSKRDLLGEYKRGLMQKLFAQELRFTKANGQPFPDWEEKRLGEVFTERSERENENAELLSVTMSSGVVRAKDVGRVGGASKDKSNYKSVYQNDIAYNSMRMWQGANGVSAYDGIVSPAYTVITPQLGQFPDFWGYYFKLKKVIQEFQRHSQGLTSDTWNLKFPALSSIKLHIPHPDEQQKIADALSALDVKIAAVADQITALQDFKKGLLQEMFV
jgi:type I restriction enzyme S subunit